MGSVQHQLPTAAPWHQQHPLESWILLCTHGCTCGCIGLVRNSLLVSAPGFLQRCHTCTELTHFCPHELFVHLQLCFHSEASPWALLSQPWQLCSSCSSALLDLTLLLSYATGQAPLPIFLLARYLTTWTYLLIWMRINQFTFLKQIEMEMFLIIDAINLC